MLQRVIRRCFGVAVVTTRRFTLPRAAPVTTPRRFAIAAAYDFAMPIILRRRAAFATLPALSMPLYADTLLHTHCILCRSARCAMSPRLLRDAT